MKSSTTTNPVKQHGLALLIFTVVLAFASISYTLGNISVEQLRSEQAASTQSALSRAKQALLDYALTYDHEDGNPGEFGFLPCPDYLASGTEGGSDGNCGPAQENVLGLFPWASLETGILRSGTGECLWYGVSGEYKSSPKTSMLNQDTNGAIRLYEAGPVNPVLKSGAQPEDRIVAVIIDPSEVVAPGQNRVFDDTSLCGMDYVPARYLEGLGAVNNASMSGGALVVDDFIVRAPGSDMNDQIVFITREELWETLRARGDFIDEDDSALNRLTEALAMCIAEYGNRVSNRRLPRPAAVDFAGADYRERFNYSDTAANSYLGRFPFVVNDSDSDIGHGSVPDPGQARLFMKGFCSALPVPDGAPVNLEAGEGYTTWENWKDHFFYAVSSYYAPTSAAHSGAPACDGSNCIEVNGNEYAAVVMFAGKRENAQVRNEPIAGDVDTKNDFTNYIEVSNPLGDGTGNYTPTGNDIAFCITDTDPFNVVSCD